VSHLRNLARQYWFDLLVAVLAIAAMVEVALGRGHRGAPQTTLWFCLPAIAVLALPIFARRRFPFAGPAVYWVLGMGITFVDPLLIPYANALVPMGLADAFLLGNLRDLRKAGAGLAVVVGSAVTIAYNIPGHSVSQLVVIPLQFAVGWAAGFAVRQRAEQAKAAEERATAAELERDAAARIAVAEERARIARELHDIVAHAVSVMVLQVGRAALTEMRRLLAVMRRDGDPAELAPQPGLDGLGSLVKDIGRAGLPVELHVEGEPFALPRGIDLSAYRIAQEALTNALKHADASHADVTISYAPDEVQIQVRDNGHGAMTSNGHGHGLIGIRERVKLYGGEMTAGTASGGGFVLSTRLPVPDPRG